ncbi:MAG: DAK2 domain-containing protein [Dehalococcoidia bacterium]
MQQDSWNGKNLREMFRVGTRLLSANSSAINTLNVFPVPDGDTGTNMFLTMQSAMVEANLCPDNDASGVARAMAKGALMGARGNSGVILSQILRGLAQTLEGKESFSSSDIADALLQASLMADKAVSQPTEGTILTVMREAASAAKAASSQNHEGLPGIIETAVNEARASVERTPDLLPVLRESGVVDAGGQGLYIILEGVLAYLQGKEIAEEGPLPAGLQVNNIVPKEEGDNIEYGYCTEFLLQGNGLDLEAMKARIRELGEHVLVVGDERTARIHVHTFDPGAVLSYATGLGTLHRIKIDNMEEQHQEFLTSQSEETQKPQGSISTITVASGEGLVEVFRSLGATHVVPGGETMNPSVEELLKAVEAVPTNEVIILPNNPDIFPSAQKVCEMAEKKVAIVPSRTIMQGITALVAFNFEDSFEDNIEAMTGEMANVRTGRIATAMRSMQYNDLPVTEGEVIGFVDDELTVAASTPQEVLPRLLDGMDITNCEILTVYYGNGIDWAEAEELFAPVRSRYPNLEVEVVFGGQPHYHYLISAE